MHARSSALRVGAVVFAVALGSAYVWFRSAQAGEGKSTVLPGSKSFRVAVSPVTQATASAGEGAATTGPSTAPAALKNPALFYGSKSAPVDLIGTLHITHAGIVPATSQPSTTAPANAVR
jgi:hypothetical protein